MFFFLEEIFKGVNELYFFNDCFFIFGYWVDYFFFKKKNEFIEFKYFWGVFLVLMLEMKIESVLIVILVVLCFILLILYKFILKRYLVVVIIFFLVGKLNLLKCIIDFSFFYINVWIYGK